MILLLDTSVLIDVLQARQSRRAFLANLVDAGHTLATAAINIGEVYAGLRSGEEAATEAFLDSLECYPLTRPIAQHAGRLKGTHAARGKTLTLTGMIVAATALEHGLTLLTDNRKDFPIPTLKLLPLP